MPALQNWATLSVVKDRATSGGEPPRTDWRIWLSWTALVGLTVIHGYFCLNPASVSSKAFSSLSALKPCQNSMVTGSWVAPLFSIFGAAFSVPAVQAVSRVRPAAAEMASSRFTGCLLGACGGSGGSDRGRGDGGRAEQLVAGRAEREVEGA